MTTRWEAFSDTLRAEVSDDGVLWLTKVNAKMGYGISMKMLEALEVICSDLETDTSIRAVVIDGEGEALQGGAVMVGEIKTSIKDLTRQDFADIVALGHKVGNAMSSLAIPVIGVARGGILGGGFELFLRNDFAFCTDGAQFTWPEVNVGFIAAWGGATRGGRYMPFRKAQEFLLTGLPIDGKQAEEYGLVTRSFPDSAALDEHLSRLLEHLRNCSPASFQWTKQCLESILNGDPADGEKMEAEAQVETMATGDFLKTMKAYSKGRYFDFVADEIGKER